MKRTIVAMSLLAMLVAVVTVSHVSAAPEPSAAAIDWQLEIDFKAPLPFMCKVPGDTEAKLYWFFLFEVTNKTGEDQEFSPTIDLFTDTGELIHSNRGINVAVYQGIKKLLGEPLLQNLPQACGKILQGADNAKYVVAIFKDFDPKAGEMDLFISGLSGEVVTVKLPKPIVVEEPNEEGDIRKVTKTEMQMSKTLQVKYALNTEAADRTLTTCKQLIKKWIMR